MSNNTIYLIIGGLIVIYLVLSMINRGKSKARKSRKFMEDYKRKKDE